MKSILLCVFVTFASSTSQTSVEKKLTDILFRLEMLEKENIEKDEVIASLLEKTKYCPTSYSTTGNENHTMERTERGISNPMTVGLPAAFHARLSHDVHNVGVG
ncbi:uncharacterized protein LOC125655431 [Ostrea edulis]|uniref:uncharacterized protein LOC125655431 n=1 Tax=Ostrea edulis TaxID=37623 RepID=UPI0024AF0329|nr:uncharacterized protein LOC125655431 [Ostrea edulis]